MSDITVDQQKLVMNAFASTFQNNLLSAGVVSWKQYDTEMDDTNGLNVSEQVGPRYTVTESVNGVQDLSGGVQGSVYGSEQFKVDRIFGTSMGWADFVKIRDIGEARESMAIRNAAVNLAEKIDAYIMRVAVLASNNWLGTATNGIVDYNDFVQGYTRLKEEGVGDNDLCGVLSYQDKQDLGDNVVELPGIDTMSANTYRNGFEGAIGGIKTMFTQQLPTLRTGTRTNGAVNGGNQNVNYREVAVSAAPGQYMSQTLAIDGIGGTNTIAAGEQFTIANVFAYDNRLGAALDHLQEFTVIDAATAAAGAVAALRIFPAIIVPGTGSGTDVEINTAHATVDSVPADNAAITFKGSADTLLRPRAIIQKEAIVCNTANLILPATGTAMRKQLSKLPLSVRMWQDSDFGTGAHRVRFDVVLNANIRDRRRVVRINGNGS